MNIFVETLIFMACCQHNVALTQSDFGTTGVPRIVVTSPSMNPIFKPPPGVHIPVFEEVLSHLLHCCYDGIAILKVTHAVKRGQHTHQSRDFGVLLIVFHTTPFPPKLQKLIQGSIISPIRNPTIQSVFIGDLPIRKVIFAHGISVDLMLLDGTMHQTTQRMEDRMPKFVSRLKDVGLVFKITTPAENTSTSFIAKNWQASLETNDPSEAKKRVVEMMVVRASNATRMDQQSLYSAPWRLLEHSRDTERGNSGLKHSGLWRKKQKPVAVFGRWLWYPW
jgi:hypothetical protein